jgi:hypothetical protein
MALKIDGTNSKLIFLAGTANTTTLTSSLTATPWTLTLPPNAGTAGQVLTTDGTGVLSWAAGGGLPAAPVNSVQFNNGGAFGGSSNLTWINGSNFLGIGTTAPLCALHVKSPNVNQVGQIAIDATGQASGQLSIIDTSLPAGDQRVSFIVTDTATTTTYFYSNTQAINLVTKTAKPIIFDTNNAFRVIIDPTGNVGIGTPTPSHKLEVIGDAYAEHCASTQGMDLNLNSIPQSYTLPTNYNSVSGGPILTPAGVTVTVNAGSRWTVV